MALTFNNSLGADYVLSAESPKPKTKQNKTKNPTKMKEPDLEKLLF